MTRKLGESTSAEGWARSTVATSGDALPRRGELWWVRVDKRRPAVVVQTDRVREPRVRSFLVVPLTSRLHLEGLPGNVRLDRRATRLPKASVANVYDLQKVLRSDFLEPLGLLPAESVGAIDEGLRLVLEL
ncbi:MAG: type II toxin-antitoxin system PemK/MazF family toxin [Vicinamibacteria bacterium]